MYILVHLDVSARREVVGVGQTLQLRVHLGIARGRAYDAEGAGAAGSCGAARGGSCGASCGISPGAVPVAVPGPGVESLMRETLPRRAAVPSIMMATMAECRSALDRLSDNLAGAEGDVRSAASLDRSLSCHIKDLDITFTGRLTGGRIQVLDTVEGPPPQKAEIRLAMTGDDLVALVNGELNFAKAWGSGRVRLEAGFRDLLKLRSLL